ncbi:MAG: hypothetical protein RL662_127, partial [Bacteroidota bacterium]
MSKTHNRFHPYGHGHGRGASLPVHNNPSQLGRGRRLVPPAGPAPVLSEYRQFLNTHIVGKQPAALTQEEVNQWEDIPNTPEGQITNEIARKFNNHHPLGIGRVNSVNTPGSLASYWGYGTDGTPEFTFPTAPPHPNTVGHELIHANDHQTDNLNARGWDHLGRLHKDNDFNSREFKESVTKIQNKISPAGDFSNRYKNDLIRGPMIGEINSWRNAQNPPIPTFAPPAWNNKKSTPHAPVDNWSATFQAISPVVRDIDLTSGVQNRPFFLGGPSEFPAFMSERLINSWRAKEEPNPLSLPEARFLHSTLGDMGTAYPA